MAYNIVSSAEFKPISYSDIVAPLVQYRDEYQRVEDLYSQLLEKTIPWKAELEGYSGSDAYNTYNNFYNELNAAMEDFSKGMTTENAKGLLGLKRRHLSDIYPIERAVKKIDEWEKFKADIKKSNPYAEFTQDNISIDDVIKGVKPNKDYWDGSASMQRVTAKAGALAKSLYSKPTKNKIWLDGQYFSIESLNGMPVEEFMKVLYHPNNLDTEASKMMRKIIDDELALINEKDFSKNTYNKILNTINTAMYAGLANPKYENVVNQDHITPMDRMNYNLRERQVKNDEDKEKNQQNILDGKTPYASQTDKEGNTTEYYYNKLNPSEFTVVVKNNKGEVIDNTTASNKSFYPGKSGSFGDTDYTKEVYDDGMKELSSYLKTKDSDTLYFYPDGTLTGSHHDMEDAELITDINEVPEKIKVKLTELKIPLEAAEFYRDDDKLFNEDDWKVVISKDIYKKSFGVGSNKKKSETPAGIP